MPNSIANCITLIIVICFMGCTLSMLPNCSACFDLILVYSFIILVYVVEVVAEDTGSSGEADWVAEPCY